MFKDKFIKTPFKAITLIGMSGVGKSHISAMLEKSDNWYHFSVDYLIGKYYIADHIPHADEITKEDITPIARWMGILGDPAKGGTKLKTIKRHQRLYHDAEVLACQALPAFANVAKEQGHAGIINDTTGSFVELDYPELPEIIAEKSLIVYIEASDEDKNAIFERAAEYPKPMFYPKGFLDKAVVDFMAEQGVSDENAIDPKAFFDWCYPKLFEQRLPKYKAIADQYGITISSDALKSVQSTDDFIRLIKDSLQSSQPYKDVQSA